MLSQCEEGHSTRCRVFGWLEPELVTQQTLSKLIGILLVLRTDVRSLEACYVAIETKMNVGELF